MVIREKESEAGTRGTKGTGLACGNATINSLGMWARWELRGIVSGPRDEDESRGRAPSKPQSAGSTPPTRRHCCFEATIRDSWIWDYCIRKQNLFKALEQPFDVPAKRMRLVHRTRGRPGLTPAVCARVGAVGSGRELSRGAHAWPPCQDLPLPGPLRAVPAPLPAGATPCRCAGSGWPRSASR